MHGTTWTTVFLLLAAAFTGAGSTVEGQKARSPQPEQTFFSADQPLQHEVPLSPAVVTALLRVKRIREIVESDQEYKDDPAKLFLAAQVHLTNGKDVDLVVAGLPPLTGADNDWFWIVCSARKNPRVVLFAGAYSLQVLNVRSNGYRDIRTLWSSASYTTTRIYRFDGKRYKLWREKWKTNR